ncbi:hypothetical protein D3C77_449870 [compost metagenome]
MAPSVLPCSMNCAAFRRCSSATPACSRNWPRPARSCAPARPSTASPSSLAPVPPALKPSAAPGVAPAVIRRCCCSAKPAPARSCWPMRFMPPQHGRTRHLSASTAPPFRKPCWKPSSLARLPAPIPVPIAKGVRASCSWRKAARCFSMKSATCRCRCKVNCFGYYRRKNTNRWAPTRCCAVTSGSLPQRPPTSRRPWPVASFVPTCTTV